MVSASRISPTRITSGDWRMMLRSVMAKSGRVAAHFDLLNHRAAIAVLILHRDLRWSPCARRVASFTQIDERGQRGPLAAARRARSAAPSPARVPPAWPAGAASAAIPATGSSMAAAGCRPPGCRADGDVDAETAEAFAVETEVHRFVAAAVPRPAMGFEQRQHQAADVFRLERWAASQIQRAIDAEDGGGAGHHNHVGCIAFRGRRQ